MVHFSFSPIKFCVTVCSAALRARVFKFLIHFESGQVYYETEKQDAEIYFYHLFSIFPSLPLMKYIYREICVKDFSGTTALRILKFGTRVGYDLLYCVKETQHAALIIRFICPFSFSPIKLFITEFSAPIIARVLKFCIHLERGQVYCRKENQHSVINFCPLFPFFHF